jgi:hypothetical protein
LVLAPAASLALEIGNATALHFGDGALVGVTAQTVLNSVPKPAISEMKPITQRCGIVVAAVPDFRVALLINGHSGTPRRDRPRSREGARSVFFQNGLTKLFADAGLADVRRCSRATRMDCANFAIIGNRYWGGRGPGGVA